MFNKIIKRTKLDPFDLNFGSRPGSGWQSQPEFEAMLDSVSKNGIICPPFIINTKGGKLIKWGNQRVLAAQVVGTKLIPCVVITLERDLETAPIVDGDELKSLEDAIHLFKNPVQISEGINYTNGVSSTFHLTGELRKKSISSPEKIQSFYLNVETEEYRFYNLVDGIHTYSETKKKPF